MAARHNNNDRIHYIWCIYTLLFAVFSSPLLARSMRRATHECIWISGSWCSSRIGGDIHRHDALFAWPVLPPRHPSFIFSCSSIGSSYYYSPPLAARIFVPSLITLGRRSSWQQRAVAASDLLVLVEVVVCCFCGGLFFIHRRQSHLFRVHWG